MAHKIKTSVEIDGTLTTGEYGTSTGHILLDTTPTNAPTSVGALFWDAENRTLAVNDGVGNTTLQVGQEERTLIHNNTGVALTDGQVVYITGSTGELPSVALASNTSEATSNAVLGIVTEPIANGANGFITSTGVVHGLNTLSFNEGDVLWLGSTPGTFTNIKPISPNHLVLIGYVVKKAGGNGSILVKIQNTQELSESSDVLFGTLANNDLLVYESSTGLWKNKSVNSVIGYTPENVSNKQNSLAADGTGVKYPTVDAINANVVHIAGNETITGSKVFTGASTRFDIPLLLKKSGLSEYNQVSSYSGKLQFTENSGTQFNFSMGSDYFDFGIVSLGKVAKITNTLLSANRTYDLPNASGTIALTSDLSSYAPITGGTGYIQNQFSSAQSANMWINGFVRANNAQISSWSISSEYARFGHENFNGASNYGFLQKDTGSLHLAGTSIAFSGAATFSSTVTASNGTLIGGTGTANYLPKFAGANSLGNSLIYDNGTNVGIGTTSATQKLVVDSGSSDFKPIWVRSSFLLSSKYYSSLLAGYALTTNQSAQFGYVYDTVTATNSYAHITPFGSTEGSKFMVRADGNVGIGYAAPDSKLVLAGALSGTVGIGGSTLKLVNTTTGNYASITAGITGVANSGMQLSIGNSPAMVINSSGNVGIGTTTDNGYKLNVNGSAYFASTVDALNLRTYNGGSLFLRNPANTFDWALYNNVSNVLKLDFNGANRLQIDSGGAATFSSTVTASNFISNDNINGYNIEANKTGGYGSSLALKNSSTLSNALIRFFKPNNTDFYNLYTSSTGIELNGTIAASNGTLLGGTLTSGYVPKATGANSLGNSLIYDNGTKIGIGITSPSQFALVDANGQFRVSNLDVQGFYQARKSDTAGSGVYGGSSFVLRNGATSEDLNFDVFNRVTSAWYTPMVIKNTGNVGIGTTSPSAKLHIQDTNGGVFFDGGGATYNRFKSTTSSASVGRDLLFSAQNSGTTPDLYINSVGNVGIGTTSPSGKLDIYNNIAFSLASLATASDSRVAFRIKGRDTATNTLAVSSNNTTDYILQVVNSDGTSSGNILLNSYGGNVGIGTTSPSNLLSVGVANSTTGKGITIENTSGTVYGRFGVINPTVDNNTYIGSISNNSFLLYTNNTERMRITSSGDVLIGATTDDGSASKLQVNGSINITNSYFRYNNNTGIVGSGSSITGGTSSQLGIRAGNEMLFATGGSTERMRISSTGNVCIGTTVAPYSNILNTQGGIYNQSISGAGLILRTLSNGSTASPIDNSILWKSNSPSDVASINVQDARTNVNGVPMIFSTRDNSNVYAERFRISNTGNVGIGTTTPIGKVDIFTGITGADFSMSGQQNGSISFSNAGTVTAVPTMSGKSNDGTGLLFIAGTNDVNSSPDMRFDARTNTSTDFTTLTTPAFKFTRAGNSLIDILRNGNVLIGTTSDNGNKLRVVGGSTELESLKIANTPTTSVGTPILLTWNSTTKGVESVPYATFAPTASPTFTGTPIAPTATAGTNTTQIATTAFVQNAVSAGGGVSSGTYTPTYTNGTNTHSFIIDNAVYTRVGNLVTVNIGYRISFLSNSTYSSFILTVPINRNVDTAMMVGHGSNETGALNQIPVLVNTISPTSVNVYMTTGQYATGSSRNGHITFTYSIN